MLNRSLSIILPVHNAQSTLARQIHQLLDILHDYPSHFELLIVDDGSTDHTGEIASELAREFPQVRTARHAQQRGSAAALETGMENTSGDIIFLQDERARMMPAEVRRIRRKHDEEQLIMARSEPQPRGVESGLIHALAAWKTLLNRPSAPNVQPSGSEVIDHPTSQTRGDTESVAGTSPAPLAPHTTASARDVSLPRPNFLTPRKGRWQGLQRE